MQSTERFTLGDYTVDLQGGMVLAPDGERPLRAMEVQLLRAMRRAAGAVVSRNALLESVWGYRSGVVSRTVDTTVKTLRRKLEADPARPRFLITERGVGYRLVVPPDPTELPGVLDTELVGRDGELAALARRLDHGARLVTVVGPPGVGKSRLARELAARRERSTVLGDPTVEDVRALAGRPAGVEPALLILDDVDGLGPPLSAALRRSLQRDPLLQIVTTSRARLEAGCASVFALGPLAVPPPGARSLSVLMTSPASRLFVAIARAAEPDFAPSGEDAAAVADVVRALDGLPLAIELAAARVGLLGPIGVLRSLDHRGALLTGPGRSRGRGSYDAALDESWGRLSADEKAVFGAVASFEGSFTLDDVEEVAPAVDGAAGTALALADRSLLEGASGGRLRVPRSIRHYVRRRAPDADAGRSHARWFARRAAADPLDTGGAVATVLDDLRAAAAWCSRAGDSDAAGPIANALLSHGYYSGAPPVLAAEARGHLRGVQPTSPWALRIDGWDVVDLLGRDDPRAADRARSLVERARAANDRGVERWALGMLGSAARLRGDEAGTLAAFRAQVSVARTLDDARHLGRALLCLASVSPQPTRLLEESMRCCRAGRDYVFVVKALSLLGSAELRRGRPARAERRLRQSVELAISTGNVRSEGMCRLGLAGVLEATGRPERARHQATAAADCSARVEDLASLRRARALLRSLPGAPTLRSA